MAKTIITATCACRSLKVELDGIAGERHMCCCEECQRRTGSPVSVSWYYRLDALLGVSGDYGTYSRTGTKGMRYDFHFCLGCGATVFWHANGDQAVGVAGGCIPVAEHVPPQDVVWVRSKPAWFEPPRDIPWYREGTKSDVVWRPDR